MDVKFVEAGNGFNWGKFAVGQFTAAEWRQPANYPGTSGSSLLLSQGWDPRMHRLVLDLATGEGVVFRLGGNAHADLDKHKVWVCPLFEPFLGWLNGRYRDNTLTWWDKLPSSVELPHAPASMAGYRRAGVTSE